MQIHTTFSLLICKTVLIISEVITWLFEKGNCLAFLFRSIFHCIKAIFKTFPKLGKLANKNVPCWLLLFAYLASLLSCLPLFRDPILLHVTWRKGSPFLGPGWILVSRNETWQFPFLLVTRSQMGFQPVAEAA